MLSNGCFVPITQSGFATLHIDVIFLFWVHYYVFLPWQKNVLSVKQLYLDKNITMAFLPNSFHIKDLSTGTLILDGSVKDGLYKLTLPLSLFQNQILSSGSSNIPFALTSTVNSVNSSLCYDRLGHPHQAILNQILKSMSTTV